MNPPAFQFYADDFIGGTVDMTPREVGVYILLLCIQWSRGGLPDDMQRLFLIARTNNEPDNEAAVRHVVQTKFKKCADGLLRQDRMELVRRENQIWREKSANGGKASGSKRRGDSEWGKTLAAKRDATNQQRTNNEPPNEPPNEPLTNSPSPSPSPIAAQTKRGHPDLADVVAYGQMRGLPAKDCEQFWHHFESSGWIDKNGHPIAKWQSKLMTWKVTGQSATPGKRVQYVSELKTVLEAKKAQRQAIHNRGHEDALGWRAKTPEDAADHKRLNREIAQLINQIAEMPT